MPLRKIDDVDVVAYARAVGGVVVIAEHLESFEPADGDLGDVGDEVVRDPIRVFADETGLVGTDRVEVAQEDDVPEQRTSS